MLRSFERASCKRDKGMLVHIARTQKGRPPGTGLIAYLT
jgi:hypothetical protein